MPLYSFPNLLRSLLRLLLFLVRRRRPLLRRAWFPLDLWLSCPADKDNRSTLSASPPVSDYDENDSYDPNYYVSSENNGLYDMYSAENVVPQMQAVRAPRIPASHLRLM